METKKPLLESIDDPAMRRFAAINYGPWDRLAADRPFVEGAGPKPSRCAVLSAGHEQGRSLTPGIMEGKDGLYTLVKRNDAGEGRARPEAVQP